jgi:deazaflavin-dependent oxidoreductase (nitroreductase family)
VTDKPALNVEQLAKLTAEVIASNGPGTRNWRAESSHTRAFNEHLIEEFRARNGKVGGELAKLPLLLLTARGAKSGEPRTNPLVYVEVDGRVVIIASMGGADRNPPWFHNVKANPDVSVEMDTGETFAATAVVTEGHDRDQVYARVCEVQTVFADYQTRTERVIPVVELKRKDRREDHQRGDREDRA